MITQINLGKYLNTTYYKCELLKIYSSAPEPVMEDRDEPIIGKPRSAVFNGATVTVNNSVKEMTERFRADSDENYKGVSTETVYGMSKEDFDSLPGYEQQFIKVNYKG